MRSVTTKFAAAMGAVMMTATMASAQFTFTGRTDGCFYTIGNPAFCTPMASATSGAVGQAGLSFTGATINEPALGGVASFNTLTDNFGTINLAPSATTVSYSNLGFLLAITVASPANGTGTFTSFVTGSVGLGATGEGTSNVFIDFANNDWTRLSPASSNVDARLTDLAVQIGDNFVNGQLRAPVSNVVPEPSTYMLMATGLGALGFVARRRRTNV